MKNDVWMNPFKEIAIEQIIFLYSISKCDKLNCLYPLFCGIKDKEWDHER